MRGQTPPHMHRLHAAQRAAGGIDGEGDDGAVSPRRGVHMRPSALAAMRAAGVVRAARRTPSASEKTFDVGEAAGGAVNCT